LDLDSSTNESFDVNGADKACANDSRFGTKHEWIGRAGKSVGG